MRLTTLTLLIALLTLVSSRCRYNINQAQYPYHVDTQPFQLGELNACKDFVQPGRLGCCNSVNDKVAMANFGTIDSIFGSQGGGCDICAVNLKRFWCQYACSDRQDQFMDTAQKYEEFPDPQKPGGTLMGQRVNVRVHADTACAMFNSCKRVPFVASVSAMGSPSGFLNFQGHNAIGQGHQYISMNFSYNINDSLAFTDSLQKFAQADLNQCNTKAFAPDFLIHNFTVKANCTCNTCEQACDGAQGFQYTEPDVFEGFNAVLVGGTYVGVILFTVSLTAYRRCQQKSKRK